MLVTRGARSVTEKNLQVGENPRNIVQRTIIFHKDKMLLLRNTETLAYLSGMTRALTCQDSDSVTCWSPFCTLTVALLCLRIICPTQISTVYLGSAKMTLWICHGGNSWTWRKKRVCFDLCLLFFIILILLWSLPFTWCVFTRCHRSILAVWRMVQVFCYFANVLLVLILYSFVLNM